MGAISRKYYEGRKFEQEHIHQDSELINVLDIAVENMDNRFMNRIVDFHYIDNLCCR